MFQQRPIARFGAWEGFYSVRTSDPRIKRRGTQCPRRVLQGFDKTPPVQCQVLTCPYPTVKQASLAFCEHSIADR